MFGMFNRSRDLRTEGVWIAVLLVVIFATLRYDNFMGLYNVQTFFGYNSMFILIALGMALVIMTGGIDLSVGSVVALSSVVAAYASPYGIEVALPAALLTGIAAGAINAFLITKMRIVPFIATLAMMLGARGMALVLADNKSVSVDWTSNFTKFGLTRAFGLIPWAVILAAVVFLALWIMLERTTLGRRILTIGGNPEAAKLMGVPVNQTLAITYIISGACAGLAGVILASGFGAGQPLEGLGWELSAIASVVVGGTLLTGGVGSIPATLAGAVLLGLIFNILNFENGLGVISLSAYWQSVIRGGFLLIVVILQSRSGGGLARRRGTT
ncbi:ABC transporter permease [Sulfitobacter mediterraneus]|uniref:ABC transporter permease n=1 Tax=Sulfitobacter mediterraneus TaxID=83219 RepID=UPI00248F9CAE|nr:ABC transporter permease [Sulfitobacter mediterraneus]